MTATGPKNITEKALKAALRKHAGVYVLAAKELGCDRTNVAQRVSRKPRLQAYVESIRAEVDDLADGIVIDTLTRKDIGGRPTKEAQSMARWHKDFKVRAQGLRLRLEHTGKDGAPLPATPVHVTVEYVDARPEPEDEDIPL